MNEWYGDSDALTDNDSCGRCTNCGAASLCVADGGVGSTVKGSEGDGDACDVVVVELSVFPAVASAILRWTKGGTSALLLLDSGAG